jgi:hypothetical protein
MVCLVGIASARCGSSAAPSTPDAGGGSGSGGSPDGGSGGAADGGGGNPDGGGGGLDGGSDAGGGGGGGDLDGGSADGGGGGVACTQTGPAAVDPRRYVIAPAGREQGYTAGDGSGTMLFAVTGPGTPTRNNEAPLVSADGTEKKYMSFVRGALLHSDPSGFSGILGGFSGSWSFQHFDENGNITGTIGYQSSARPSTPVVQAADPRDGTLLLGDFRRSNEPESATSRRAVFLKGVWTTPSGGSGPAEIWTAPLAGAGAVFGAGLDLASNALAIMDGSARWGAGAISAQWFSFSGTALTGEFLLISGFQPGPNTWFEVSGLTGDIDVTHPPSGSLAVRRVDSTDSSGREQSSRYLCVVRTGETSCEAPPEWLGSLRDQRIEPVMRGVGNGGFWAFAVLPDPKTVSDCTQHVELRSASGAACGGMELPMAEGSCLTQALSVGRDGTLIQPLPEKAWQCDSRGCRPTWRWWPRMFK